MSASFRGPGNEKLRFLVGAVATKDTAGFAATTAFDRKEAAPRARESGSVWVRANPATRGRSSAVPATTAVARERRRGRMLEHIERLRLANVSLLAHFGYRQGFLLHANFSRQDTSFQDVAFSASSKLHYIPISPLACPCSLVSRAQIDKKMTSGADTEGGCTQEHFTGPQLYLRSSRLTLRNGTSTCHGDTVQCMGGKKPRVYQMQPK